MKKGSFCEETDWINKHDPRTYTYPDGELPYIRKFDKLDPVLIGPHLGKLFQDY